MKKLIKPASLILYLLAFIFFFFVGMFYAKWTGAAEGQGLAGGAIVFMNGLIFAVLALVSSFFVAYYADRKLVIRANQVLLIVTLLLVLFLVIRHKEEALGDASSQLHELRSDAFMWSTVGTNVRPILENEKMGLGFFKPNFFDERHLYFYGDLNLEKAVDEHTAWDSISFERLEYGGFDISYAPPWLYPEHLKLDYEMLYFKVISEGRDFIQLEVNRQDGRTAWVDKTKGQLLYWSEFLLTVHSVALPEELGGKVHHRPLQYSDEVKLSHSFMSPILIETEWLKVELVDDGYSRIGTGWIKWRDKDRILVRYSLLS